MKRVILVAASATLLALADAAEQSDWDWRYKPFSATYSIYSGELGERTAPTPTERKLAVRVTGPAAKEIFDSMYPDEKEVCTGEKGARSRSKGNVWCTYHPGQGFTCYFGFDLRTGESIGGASC